MSEFNKQEFESRGVSYPFHDSTHHIVGAKIREDEELQGRIKEAIKDRTIIEIGCCNLVRYCLDLFYYGADSYVGVDPFNLPDIEWAKSELEDKKVSYVREDVLSYLQSQQIEGLVTFSSGTLEKPVIHNKEYARAVVSEIKRLARPEISAIHVIDPFFAKLFEDEGLQLDFHRNLDMMGNRLIGLYKASKQN